MPIYPFTTLNAPFATDGTLAHGINGSGQVVGQYSNNTGNHSFLYSGGTYTTIDDPLATQGTFAISINAAGQIVGAYFDASGGHGFLRNRNGTFTTLNDPLATGGQLAIGMAPQPRGRGVRGRARGIGDPQPAARQRVSIFQILGAAR